jgi:hypothetical protein
MNGEYTHKIIMAIEGQLSPSVAKSFKEAVSNTTDLSKAEETLQQQRARGAAMAREEAQHTSALVESMKRDAAAARESAAAQEQLTQAIHRQMGERLMLQHQSDAAAASATHRQMGEQLMMSNRDAGKEYAAQQASIAKQRAEYAKAERAMELDLMQKANAPGTGSAMIHNVGKMAEWAVAGTVIFGTLQMLRDGIKTFAEFETAATRLSFVGGNIAVGFNSQGEAISSLTRKLMDLKTAYGTTGTEAFRAADIIARSGATPDTIVADTKLIAQLHQTTGESMEDLARYMITLQTVFKMSGEGARNLMSGAWNIQGQVQGGFGALIKGAGSAGPMWNEAGGRPEQLIGLLAATSQATNRTPDEIGTRLGVMLEKLFNAESRAKIEHLTGQGLSRNGQLIGGPTGAIETLRGHMGTPIAGKLLELLGGGKGGPSVMLEMLLRSMPDAKNISKNVTDTGKVQQDANAALNTFNGQLGRANAALEGFWQRLSGPGGAATGVVGKAADTIQGANTMHDKFGMVGTIASLYLGQNALGQEALATFGQLTRDEEERKHIQTRIDSIPYNLADDFMGPPAPPPPGSRRAEEKNIPFDYLPDDFMGPPVPEELGSLTDMQIRTQSLEQAQSLERQATTIKEMADAHERILGFMEQMKSRGEENVAEYKKMEQINDKISRDMEARVNVQIRGEEMLARAKSKYEAYLLYGKDGKMGAGSAVYEAKAEEMALQAERQSIQGNNELTDKAKGVELQRINNELLLQGRAIEAARYTDLLKETEEHDRHLKQLQQQLGMLSDEDMLKARMLAGEMRRGEVNRNMDIGEFVNLSQSSRKMFGMLGGQVNGTLGIEPMQAPQYPNAPSIPRPPLPMTPGSGSVAVGNVDALASAVAREVRVQLASLFPIPIRDDSATHTPTNNQVPTRTAPRSR